MRITNRGPAPRIIAEEWREFTRPPLYLLLALGLLLLALAYQVTDGARLSVDVGSVEDKPYLVHFQRPEQNSSFDYRWSGDRSWLQAPGVGRGLPLLLTMRISGFRPSGVVPATLTVTVSGQPLKVFNPDPAVGVYTVSVPAALNNADDLAVYFDSTTFTPVGDNRKLGTVFDWIHLAPAGGALVIPPIGVAAWLLLSLLLLYMTLRHLGVAWRAAWIACAVLLLLVAALLVLDRYNLTLFAAPLGVVMISVYALALLLPPLAAWALTRLGAEPGAAVLRALMLIYLAAFAIKAGGMMHPQFTILDHGLRAHQVQELVADPIAFWQKYQNVSTADEANKARGDTHLFLGQWNLSIPFPYPPTVYYVMAPVALLVPGARSNADLLLTVCDTILVALEGSIVFALYAIAKRGLGSGRAGMFGAAIAVFAPISYLHHSDGDWTYIWGGWVGLVYIMAVVCLAERAGRPLLFVILSLLAGLAVISHPATALFLGAFVAVITILLLLGRRRWPLGFSPLPLLLSFIAGSILSLLYYGVYIGPMFTIALPAILGKVQSGAIGQDVQHLGAPLLSGFWPQIWAHFTGWPVALAAAGLGLLLIQVERSKTKDQSAENEQRGVINYAPNQTFNSSPSSFIFFRYLAVSWALVFALFSLADLKVNLLQRHMLFVLPLLGLLAGYALVRLMQWDTHSNQPFTKMGATTYHSVLFAVLKREWFGWLVAAALVAFLFVVGWEIWLNRVLRYVLPPGSG